MFAHEKFASSLEEAGYLSRTKFYWFIYSDNDYTNFDFEFRPPPWEQDHIHVFPSQWQPCGDVFLANKYTLDQKIYNSAKIKIKMPHQRLMEFLILPNPINQVYYQVFNQKFSHDKNHLLCIQQLRCRKTRKNLCIKSKIFHHQQHQEFQY